MGGGMSRAATRVAGVLCAVLAAVSLFGALQHADAEPAPSGGFVVGAGVSAMTFPEKPGLTASESQLTPYSGPTSFRAGSTGSYRFENCLVTKAIRVAPKSHVKLSFTNCKFVVASANSTWGMVGKGGELRFLHCLFDGTAFDESTYPVIIEGGGSVKFSEFTGNTDNVRLASHTRFEWNYIHNSKSKTVSGESHSDGVEIYYGARSGRDASALPPTKPHVFVQHNYIDLQGAEGATGAVNITSDFGPIDGVRVHDNTFMPAGSYSLYVRSDGYCDCGTAHDVDVTGNRWYGSADSPWGGWYGLWAIDDMSAIRLWSENTLTELDAPGQVPVTLDETQPDVTH